MFGNCNCNENSLCDFILPLFILSCLFGNNRFDGVLSSLVSPEISNLIGPEISNLVGAENNNQLESRNGCGRCGCGCGCC